MGDTWITDMTHFLDILKPEVDVPSPARRLGEYLGRIVEAATSSPPLILIETSIRCRRRPGRKPCPGHIRLVCNDDEGEIVWECTSCDDRGIIRGWEGTPWDRSFDDVGIDETSMAEPTTFEPVEGDGLGNLSRSGGPIEIVLDNAEYSACREVCLGEEIPMAILENTEHCQNGLKLTVSARNTAAFHDYLLDVAISEKNPSYVQLLGQTVKKMRAALDAYLDEIF